MCITRPDHSFITNIHSLSWNSASCNDADYRIHKVYGRLWRRQLVGPYGAYTVSRKMTHRSMPAISNTTCRSTVWIQSWCRMNTKSVIIFNLDRQTQYECKIETVTIVFHWSIWFNQALNISSPLSQMLSEWLEVFSANPMSHCHILQKW